MRTNRLFTSILAVTAIAVTSCSTPKLAQQGVDNDDVYNSTAQARVYTPVAVRPSQQNTQPAQEYQEDDYYGTSDPYYDMDYSSRINRFSYGTAWRSYYDPFFYNDWYSPYSFGLGFNNFYGGGFGWGYLSSPFWSYNNFGFGFNNFGWGYNNFYGGGLWGGGFLGGGYYGGGYYTGRTTNVPNYAARPYLGRENGVGSNRGMSAMGSTTRRSDANGNLVRERSRSERYVPNSQTVPGRTDRSTAPAQQARPARTQQAAPQPARTERPSYYTPPPARSEGSRSSGSSSGSSSGARPARSGRG